MPELLEVETYRRHAQAVVGREIEVLRVPDHRVLEGSLSPAALGRLLAGRRVVGTRRVGKLLLLDTSGPTLGIRFGMTGGLVVDGRPAIDRLLHSAARSTARWIRLRLGFRGGGELALHDPRRFARLLVDPDVTALGPDALDVGPADLRAALAAPGGLPGPALKARLLDQSRLAGVGNLLADEILWRASLAPVRPAAALSPAELRRLHRHLRTTLVELGARGGSHTGDLMAQRRPGGTCPRDGRPLARGVVGGRTTWWCPFHQR